MDVITALLSVLNEQELSALIETLLLPARCRPQQVDVAELITALEEIVTGDYPNAVKDAVLPKLSVMRDLKSLGVQSYGTFKKDDDEDAV